MRKIGEISQLSHKHVYVLQMQDFYKSPNSSLATLHEGQCPEYMQSTATAVHKNLVISGNTDQNLRVSIPPGPLT
jgi:hypothetical protein